LNEVFANHSEDDEIYPLIVIEIVDTQKADNKLEESFKPNATLDKGLELQIIQDQKCICNKGRLVIPKPL
jgi:Uma2 family endonuclease